MEKEKIYKYAACKNSDRKLPRFDKVFDTSEEALWDEYNKYDPINLTRRRPRYFRVYRIEYEIENGKLKISEKKGYQLFSSKHMDLEENRVYLRTNILLKNAVDFKKFAEECFLWEYVHAKEFRSLLNQIFFSRSHHYYPGVEKMKQIFETLFVFGSESIIYRPIQTLRDYLDVQRISKNCEELK